METQVTQVIQNIPQAGYNPKLEMFIGLSVLSLPVLFLGIAMLRGRGAGFMKSLARREQRELYDFQGLCRASGLIFVVLWMISIPFLFGLAMGIDWLMIASGIAFTVALIAGAVYRNGDRFVL